MKALVTGGMGFIGSAMVRKLIADGHEVTVVDDLSDHHVRMPASELHRLVRMYALDIEDIRQIEGEFDVVFHYAAHYANERSLAEPMKCVRTNMAGTMEVLEFCRSRNVKKLVYASSSGVYGNMDIVAYAENMPPAPSTPYEVTKYAGELLCAGFCKIYGISLVAPRFFNVYGKGDVDGPWRSVIPRFFSLAKRGDVITITGKSASRDFTFVDDVTRATLAGLNRIEEAPDRIELVYNIGTGTEVFVHSLAKMIVELTESTSTIDVSEKRHWDNAPRRVADVHKFRSLFPDVANSMTPIADGLKKSLQWYLEVC